MWFLSKAAARAVSNVHCVILGYSGSSVVREAKFYYSDRLHWREVRGIRGLPLAGNSVCSMCQPWSELPQYLVGNLNCLGNLMLVAEPTPHRVYHLHPHYALRELCCSCCSSDSTLEPAFRKLLLLAAVLGS